MTKFTRKQVQNRKRWVNALRSGEYRQTVGRLRGQDDKGYSFCCLGVMCDVYDSKVWNKTPSYLVVKQFLSDDISRLSLFSVDDYITMNDELNLTFDEIADIIIIETIERNGKW